MAWAAQLGNGGGGRYLAEDSALLRFDFLEVGGAKLCADRWRVGATVQEDGPGHSRGPERVDLQFMVGGALC